MIPQNLIRYETRRDRRGNMEVVAVLDVRWNCNEAIEGAETGSPAFVKEQELREKAKNGVYTFLYGDMKSEIQQIDKAFQSFVGGANALPEEARASFMRLYRMFEGFKVDANPNLTLGPVQEATRPRDFEGEDDCPPWAGSPVLQAPRRVRLDEVPTSRPVMRYGSLREVEADLRAPSAPMTETNRVSDVPASAPRSENCVSDVEPVRPVTRRRRSTSIPSDSPISLAAVADRIAGSSPYANLVAQPEPAVRQGQRFG